MLQITSERGVGDHGGIHRVRFEQRHCVMVQQLRSMPGHLGTRAEHHFRLEELRHRR
jgi:hypothetical protein